jgi:hypothetical protein
MSHGEACLYGPAASLGHASIFTVYPHPHGLRKAAGRAPALYSRYMALSLATSAGFTPSSLSR